MVYRNTESKFEKKVIKLNENIILGKIIEFNYFIERDEDKVNWEK